MDSSPPPQSPDDLTPDTEETLTVQGFTWDSDKVTSGLASGIEYEGYACSYAHRNGERRDIPPVADAALGLEPGHGLWIVAGTGGGPLGCRSAAISVDLLTVEILNGERSYAEGMLLSHEQLRAPVHDNLPALLTVLRNRGVPTNMDAPRAAGRLKAASCCFPESRWSLGASDGDS
ncbi:hypothetical protein [Streptomyces mirabilis]|uniref:hypothetical protein n=1 Tax=Streptomyces mirabilis TaxID=68239 RepID=UPI0033B95E9A